MRRTLYVAALGVLASAVTACSSAGGGTPPPGPSSTPVPHCAVTGPDGTTTSSINCPVGTSANSTLSINSNPAGLGVTLGSTSLGVTPTSSTPTFAPNNLVYTIQPNNAAPPYAYSFQQINGPNITLYYNQSADTSGSLALVSPTSVSRRTGFAASRSGLSSVRRLATSSFGRPLYSTSRIAVFYHASALQASGRSVSDVERSAGVARATTLGPAGGATITRILDIPAGQTFETLAASLKADPAVSGVERVQMRYTQSSAPVFPNDSHFNSYEQWDMYRINAPNAWGYTEGSTGVSIAVIDTGADLTLPDLSGKVTHAEKVLNSQVTFGTAAVVDLSGHGTNVAGIAAAQGNNNSGFAGVGFNTSLQIYRIFPDSVAPKYEDAADYGASTSDEAQAIYDAVAQGAKVINLSLGSPAVNTDAANAFGFNIVEHDAVEYAISKGVTVVAAAGNGNVGNGTPGSGGIPYSTIGFPAAYDGVISVGASKLNDNNANTYSSAYTESVAKYSNYGPNLTVVAPGGDPSSDTDADLLHWITNIVSTTVANPKFRCDSPNDCFTQIAGTSQAAPHAAGAAALMLAANPNLSPAQILQTLEATADDIGDPKQGHGRINLYRALAAVTGDAAPSLPVNANFVAIAYIPDATSNKPNIINVTYKKGVPVAGNGSFRVADILPTAGSYKIGVWYDANGDGLVDQGDWFGASATCTPSAACSSAIGITVHPVPAGFTLN